LNSAHARLDPLTFQISMLHFHVSISVCAGWIFFWTRFHNFVVFDGENCACTNCIAKQRYIRGNSFATEDLGIHEYSCMTIAGESLLSLYKKSYTVQLLSCFYNLAWETGSVWYKRKRTGVVRWISKWQKTEGLH